MNEIVLYCIEVYIKDTSKIYLERDRFIVVREKINHSMYQFISTVADYVVK